MGNKQGGMASENKGQEATSKDQEDPKGTVTDKKDKSKAWKKAGDQGKNKQGTTGGKEGEGKKGEEEKGEGEEEKEEEEEQKPFHFDGEHEYQGIMYPASVPVDILKRIKDFKFRPDDVVVAGYPKCGECTTAVF